MDSVVLVSMSLGDNQFLGDAIITLYNRMYCQRNHPSHHAPHKSIEMDAYRVHGIWSDDCAGKKLMFEYSYG